MPLLAPAAALLAAFLLSIALMPMVRWLATRLGLLDHPDHGRRRHERAIPRLGGVAVFASVVTVGVVGALFADRAHILRLMPLILGLAAGATILLVTGLVDDIRGVRPSVKIVVQLAAALIVYRAGFRVDSLMLTSHSTVTLGAYALPVTLLWIVGLSNALNLVDGADGLAAGVSTIALVVTGISAAAVHDTTVLWCSMALLGAMLGFLKFNWPPARIFLGDSGSLVVGFLLAVLTVKGATRADGMVYAFAPIFALSYPLLDTGLSMLRRWLRGDPLSRADGRHIHHQLLALGLAPRRALLLICGLSAAIALLGPSTIHAPPRLDVAIAIAGSAALLFIFVYGVRRLHYHEVLEAGWSLTSAALTGRAIIRDRIHARDVAELLQGAETFDQIALLLADNAARFRFVHVELQGRPETGRVVAPVPAQLYGVRMSKLEYPVARGDAELSHPMTLSIWCAVERRGSPAGAEGVAKILAAAITDWRRARAPRDGVDTLVTNRDGRDTHPHQQRAVGGRDRGVRRRRPGRADERLRG
jgi:UDP-GlcNAc:undecaprenyl-phosphate GlcNAc-1-phosphate transferase